MTLNPHPTFPASGHYVLRLHQDASPEAGYLFGRVQHVASGEGADFSSSEALLKWLICDAAQRRRAARLPEGGLPSTDPQVPD